MLVRYSRKLLAIGACASALAVSASPLFAGDTYYISAGGNDNADGLTPATAWASLDKVNATTFSPGSQILFERGDEWRGSLSASSSGTTDAPIVYGAYGSGAKPKFWGSDPVANGSFAKVDGTSSTYSAPVGTTVNALLADHQFLSSAAMKTGSSDPAANRSYVDANPNSWAYDNGRLYVNTGGADPAGAGAHAYTAAVRDDVVYSNGKDNLVFRDLVVDESAKRDAGYAFRVMNSNNVRIENAEAYHAGKHDVGVINSDNFVGQGLHAAMSMPDQGFGGATAFVAYSNPGRSGDDSQWIDCVAENMGAGYSAFYTHGEGVGDVLVKNLTGRDGAGIGIATDASTTQHVRVLGGRIDNATLSVLGDDVVIDGVRVTGPDSVIDLRGNDNVVQNVTMTGTSPSHSEASAIVDRGFGNLIQFNTVLFDSNAPLGSTALAIMSPTTDTRAYHNIFFTPYAAIRQWFYGRGAYSGDFNMVGSDALFGYYIYYFTLAQWQSLGYDLHSVMAEGLVIDGGLGVPPRYIDGTTGQIINTQGYGAFATVPEPSMGAIAIVAGGLSLLRRRRRR